MLPRYEQSPTCPDRLQLGRARPLVETTGNSIRQFQAGRRLLLHRKVSHATAASKQLYILHIIVYIYNHIYISIYIYIYHIYIYQYIYIYLYIYISYIILYQNLSNNQDPSGSLCALCQWLPVLLQTVGLRRTCSPKRPRLGTQKADAGCTAPGASNPRAVHIRICSNAMDRFQVTGFNYKNLTEILELTRNDVSSNVVPLIWYMWYCN